MVYTLRAYRSQCYIIRKKKNNHFEIICQENDQIQQLTIGLCKYAHVHMYIYLTLFTNISRWT